MMMKINKANEIPIYLFALQYIYQQYNFTTANVFGTLLQVKINANMCVYILW